MATKTKITSTEKKKLLQTPFVKGEKTKKKSPTFGAKKK
jgi:hypothetical protein